MFVLLAIFAISVWQKRSAVYVPPQNEFDLFIYEFELLNLIDCIKNLHLNNII